MPISSLLMAQPNVSPETRDLLNRLKGVKMPVPGPSQGQAPAAAPSPMQAGANPATEGVNPPPSAQFESSNPQIDALNKQHQDVTNQIGQLQQQLSQQPDLNSMIQKTLGNEQDYVNNSWANSKYNPQGKGGKAVMFLTDMLRGMQRQPSLQQAVTQASKLDYQNAVKDQAQQIQLQRTQQSQQLNALKAQQLGIQQQMQDAQRQLGLDQKDYITKVNLLRNQNWRQATDEEVQDPTKLPKGFIINQLPNPLNGKVDSWTGPSTMKLVDMPQSSLVKKYFPDVDQNQPLPATTIQSYIKSATDQDENDKKIKAAADLENQKRLAPTEAQIQAFMYGLPTGNDMLDKLDDTARDKALARYKEAHPAAQLGQANFDFKTKSEAEKLFDPAMDSAERFNIMTDNYRAATKDNDQQAMLSLLANHIGMTMGLQKGARINQAMYNEAARSMPLLSRIQAKFGPDGYLSGVTLSPDQMRQMVDLGRNRFAEDVQKARSKASYMGIKDDGPDRVLKSSTMSYYLNLAGGDVNKAKAMAAKDGWSTK